MDAALKEMYQQVILDHSRSPRNRRTPEVHNHHAHGHNPFCGDKVEIFLDLDDTGRIQDVAFEGEGCAISLSSASMMTELLKGRSVEEADKLMAAFLELVKTGESASLRNLDENAASGLEVLSGVSQFPTRVKCATLPWHTFKAALESEKSGPNGKENTSVTTETN